MDGIEDEEFDMTVDSTANTTTQQRPLDSYAHGEIHETLTCHCAADAKPNGNHVKFVVWVDKSGKPKRSVVCPNKTKASFNGTKVDNPGCNYWVDTSVAQAKLDAIRACWRGEFSTLNAVIGETLLFPPINHNLVLQKRAQLQSSTVESAINDAKDALRADVERTMDTLTAKAPLKTFEEAAPASSKLYLDMYGETSNLNENEPHVAWLKTNGELTDEWRAAMDEAYLKQVEAGETFDTLQTPLDEVAAYTATWSQVNASLATTRPAVVRTLQSAPGIYEPPITLLERRALVWLCAQLVAKGYAVPKQVSFYKDIMEGDSFGYNFLESSLGSAGDETSRAVFLQWMPTYLRAALGYDLQLVFGASQDRKRIKIVPAWQQRRGDDDVAANKDDDVLVAFQLHNMAPNDIGWFLKDADWLLVQTQRVACDEALPSRARADEWVLVHKRRFMCALFNSSFPWRTFSDTLPVVQLQVHVGPYVDWMARKSAFNAEAVEMLHQVAPAIVATTSSDTAPKSFVTSLDNEDDDALLAFADDVEAIASARPARRFDVESVLPQSMEECDNTTAATTPTMSLPAAADSPTPMPDVIRQLYAQTPIIHFSRQCGFCMPHLKTTTDGDDNALPAVGVRVQTPNETLLQVSFHHLADKSGAEALSSSQWWSVHGWQDAFVKVNCSQNLASDVYLLSNGVRFMRYITDRQLIIQSFEM